MGVPCLPFLRRAGLRGRPGKVFIIQRFFITNVKTRMGRPTKIAILVLLTTASSFAQVKSWHQILGERLPYFGDQNWIVVADSAFPLRSSLGIETIVSSDSQVNTVRQVLDMLAKHAHVRPVVHTDLELEHVAEQDAPGESARIASCSRACLRRSCRNRLPGRFHMPA